MSLKGSPKFVGGDFDCASNQLLTLEGVPESIGRYFYCNNNPVTEIYHLFNTPKCLEWLNEYSVIRGNTVILSRLEDVFHELGMKVPDEIELENYRLI